MANSFIDHTKNISEILEGLEDKPELLEKEDIEFGNLYLIPKGSIIESKNGRRKIKIDMVVNISYYDDNWANFHIGKTRYKTHRTCIKSYVQEYITFFFEKKRYRVHAELYYESEQGQKYSFSSNKTRFTPLEHDPIFELDGIYYCPKEWGGDNEIQLKAYYRVDLNNCVVYKAERFPFTEEEKKKKKKDVARKYKEALKSFKEKIINDLRWKHSDFFDHEATEEEMTAHSEALMLTMVEAIEEYEKKPKYKYELTAGTDHRRKAVVASNGLVISIP